MRDEMIALAHVEAARVADIVGVGEVDLLLGTHRAPAVARLLERNAVLAALGDIEEGAAVGTEQPLVGRERDEVRVERAHVDLGDADAMRGVDQQCCALRAQCRRDAVEIDRAAVRPVHRRDRGERNRRRAWSFDRGEHRSRPVAVGGTLYGFDGEALGARPRQPFQHRGRMIVRQHEDARACQQGTLPVMILPAVATP